MEIPKKRCVILIVGCMIVLMAVPVFAGQISSGPCLNHGSQGFNQIKNLEQARNLTHTLQGKGVDVTPLNIALDDARAAHQASNSTAFRNAMRAFHQAVRAAITSGSLSQADLQDFYPKPLPKSGNFPGNYTTDEKFLEYAENLTQALQGKGVAVNLLTTALNDARAAHQASNSTAFRDAMRAFHQAVRAGIADGSIPAADLPRFRQGPMGGEHRNISMNNSNNCHNSTPFKSETRKRWISL